jgi:hypothetical protein
VPDKLPFEVPVRRAFEANFRYYEALGRVTQEYWQALFGIFRELPLRVGDPGTARAAAPPPATGAIHGAPTIVLEAEGGAEAGGVFLVENRLSRTVSTAAVGCSFADPSGRAIQPALRFVPGVVTLEPGGRTLVQVFATVSADLEPETPYRGEIRVPGLSEHGIPALLRRRTPTAPSGRAGRTTPATGRSAARGGTSRRPSASRRRGATNG